MSHYTYFYTEDEVEKLIKALQKKYKFTDCDGLPYHMESTKIILSGKIVEKDDKQDKLLNREEFTVPDWVIEHNKNC